MTAESPALRRSLWVRCMVSKDKAVLTSLSGVVCDSCLGNCPMLCVCILREVHPEAGASGQSMYLCPLSLWRAHILHDLVARVLLARASFISQCISLHKKKKGRRYFWCLILLLTLFSMILKLACHYPQLQVLFYILKRFADKLAGRYRFIVKKFLPTLTCTAMPRTWNLESGDCMQSGSWETLR